MHKGSSRLFGHPLVIDEERHTITLTGVFRTGKTAWTQGLLKDVSAGKLGPLPT